VSIGDISSAVYDLKLARNAPATFEIPDPATSQFIAAALDEDSNLVTTNNPVISGKVVQLFANGLGPVDHRPLTGEATPYPPLVLTVDPVSVTIGGKPATKEFSGLSPGSVALYQVNVTVPSDVPAGIQPLVITVNGVSSKPVNLPVQ
jgi:uncharacterized protein (TIGR03437 family)